MIKIKVKKPGEIANRLTDSGKKKAGMSIDKMLILGFLAGAFVAMGGLLALRLSSGLSANGWGSIASFLFAAVFPVGLIMIVFTGSELATGNMTTQPIAFFDGKIELKGVIKNWFFVFVGNVLGSLFVAYFFGKVSGLLMSETVAGNVVNIANAKVSLSWTTAFWRGVGCNWLVGIAIWMALATDNLMGKVTAIWWPIMAFVALGFEHSIANTFFVPAGIYISKASTYVGPALDANWSSFIINNLIPVTLGNIVGAGVFVALVGWYVFLREERSEDIEKSNKMQM